MKAIEALAAKIDSEDALLQVVSLLSNEGLSTGVSSNYTELPRLHNAALSNQRPWWLTREALRLKHGVYQTSEVIDTINACWAAQHVLHIAKDDPSMVAYTPAPEFGMRDAQLKTSLGKFLRKHFILLTDAGIQALEASHRAELAGDFELATTVDELRDVYMNMEGDSGCMRYDPEHFGIADGIHPSAVYCAPGVGVAYTKSPDGRIKSRSVVYVNPSDPEDKRYVRIYGDPVLAKILHRRGYRVASLAGAKLAKIPFVPRMDYVTNSNTFVMPYLDGPGGNQSSRDGCHVVQDGDSLRVATPEEVIAISSTLGADFLGYAKSTGAKVTMLPLPDRKFTSEMTGIVHDSYSAVKVTYFDEGTQTLRCAEKLEAITQGYVEMRTPIAEAASSVVWHTATTPSFTDSGLRWKDDDGAREYCGHVRLDTEYYPDGPEWAVIGTVPAGFSGGIMRRIFRADAYIVLPEVIGDEEDDELFYMHRSELATLRKSGFINAAPMQTGGARVLIHRKRPTLARTVGGTVFDTVKHSRRFVKTWDGEWVTKTSVREYNLFGRKVYGTSANFSDYPVETHLAAAFEASTRGTQTLSLLAEMNESTDLASARQAVLLVKAFVDTAVAHQRGERFALNANDKVRMADSSHASWDDQVKAARALELDSDLALSDLVPYYRESAIINGRYVRTLNAWLVEKTAPLRGYIAAREAEEAGQTPLPLTEARVAETEAA